MKIGKETETVEFKKSTGELKESIISIVAMLNKHKRGELYFGVRNDGLAVGQDVTEKTLRAISQAIAHHIEPQILPIIKIVVIDNQNCIHIEFEGNNTPYFAYGRAYSRVADEDRLLSPKELESYILSKNILEEKWDTEVSEKTIDDINEDVLKEFIDRANTAGRVNYAYTNKRSVLNKLGLLVGDRIVNTGKVLFCENTNLEIQMAIFATNERLTFNDIKRTSGNLFELVEKAEKYIRNNIRWRVEFDGSIQRKEIPEIPMDALREALVNSFCHKNYRVMQNNEVAIYQNRIEIYNPGTFPEGLTPNDFIVGSERSIKRNPLIAQLLYYSKDIESFGTGLKRISRACESANVKVDFQMLKSGFSVIFYRSEIEVTDKMTEGVTERVTERVTDKMTEGMTEGMTDKIFKRAIIVDYLKVHKFITNKVTCDLLNISATTAKRFLKTMVTDNIIVAIGDRSTRKYALNKEQL